MAGRKTQDPANCLQLHMHNIQPAPTYIRYPTCQLTSLNMTQALPYIFAICKTSVNMRYPRKVVKHSHLELSQHSTVT